MNARITSPASAVLQAFTLIALFAANASDASAQTVVYDTGPSTGFFTPFTSSTPAGKKFGESGWFGFGGDAPVALQDTRLGLTTFSSSAPVAAGEADITFTFNDGDPSGLVFGSAAQLYSVTLKKVTLPATNGVGPSNFTLTIPLPGVVTTGGFNNVGWSVSVSNFNFAGQFGFQNRGNFNSAGFYTNNASEYFPATNSWQLFAFGPNDPSDIANFVATVTAPEPLGAGMLIALSPAALLARRRSR